MAEKENITLKYDTINKVFVPVKLPKSFKQRVVEALPIAGELAKYSNKKSGPASYSVSVDIALDPSVIDLEDEYDSNGNVVGTTLIAPVSLLAKYNPAYKPEEPKQKTSLENIPQTIADIRRGGTTTDKVKVTPEDFISRVQNIIKPEEIKKDSLTGKIYYTPEEVEQSGQVITDPQSGMSEFKFRLVAPDYVTPSGDVQEDMLPAVLLPSPGGGIQTNQKYYVEYLPNAVENIINKYNSRKQISQLKKTLWEAGYISDADYNKTIRGNNANLADSITRIGLSQSLVDTSVKNMDLVMQKRYTPVSLEDELLDRYQPGAVAETRVLMPSLKAIDDIINAQFKKYKGRPATEEEKKNGRIAIQQAAVDSVQRTTKMTTPAGEGVTLEMGDAVFNNDEIAEVAADLTKGDPERKAYYGAQRFANALNKIVAEQDFGSTDDLESLLR